jgi:hypothetical protein
VVNSHLLYQLSYRGTNCGAKGLIPPPAGLYQLSYRGISFNYISTGLNCLTKT